MRILKHARAWINRQMGVTPDSPWRAEPETWPEGDNVHAIALEAARRLGADAVLIVLENPKVNTMHLGLAITTNDKPSDFLVHGVAQALRALIKAKGGEIVDLTKGDKS